MESSPEHATQILNDISSELMNWQEDRPLVLESEMAVGSAENIRLPSSLARELFYVLEHAIHHMALIRVLVLDAHPGFEMSERFGVAYSTLAHRERLTKP